MYEDLAERSPSFGREKLAGKDDLYHIREGDYRIIYTIQHLES
jgi:mRNA-degrading endonuclease RelE of RelBE toxin-antitoxin system